jgi:integrase
MATFRLRSNKWQARVQKKGYEAVTKSFITKADAVKWATQIEADIDKGIFTNISLAERTTFEELIIRYSKEVTSHTKSTYEDGYRLRALARRPVAKLNMLALTTSKIAEYRDIRLQEVSAGTVIRELAYFSSIINHSRREWGINIDNPISLVRKPQSPPSRKRVLSPEEQEILLSSLKPRRHDSNHWILFIVQFALETAMRQGEILALSWTDIDLNKRTAHLQTTKNGDSRTVPLSTRAVQILHEIPRSIDGRVFPMNKAALSANFSNACKRADIEDLHFHDLRHDGISRMFVPGGYSIPEVAAVSGHKSWKNLQRYTQIRPEELHR